MEEFPVSWWNTKHQHTSDVILMFLSWKLCQVLLTLQETTGGIGQEKSASGSIMFCEYFICRLIKRTLNFWQMVLKLAIAYWTVENRPPPSMLVWGTIPLRSCWKSNTDLTLYCLSWRVQLGKSLTCVVGTATYMHNFPFQELLLQCKWGTNWNVSGYFCCKLNQISLYFQSSQ